MTANAHSPALERSSSTAMIRVLGAIAMLSGFLVVVVHQVTLPYIEENRRLAIERAVFHVIPGAVERRDLVLTRDGLAPAEGAMPGTILYAGYDPDGRLLGIAAEASHRGYQDVIRILYGYSPACECITGIRVIESRETPGLGDKIGTDPAFLTNFEALDARLADDRSGLRNAIVTVRRGTKAHPWEIDGISGATVSANAVGRMLNDSANALLPHLLDHVDTLRSPSVD
jgi:Na+-translocating ferredoxin:NAD+ oxidoreductase subunit G